VPAECTIRLINASTSDRRPLATTAASPTALRAGQYWCWGELRGEAQLMVDSSTIQVNAFCEKGAPSALFLSRRLCFSCRFCFSSLSTLFAARLYEQGEIEVVSVGCRPAVANCGCGRSLGLMLRVRPPNPACAACRSACTSCRSACICSHRGGRRSGSVFLQELGEYDSPIF